MSACTLYPMTSPCEGLSPVLVNPYLPTTIPTAPVALGDVAPPQTPPMAPMRDDEQFALLTDADGALQLATRTTPVPEPSALLLLAMALAIGLRQAHALSHGLDRRW